MIPHLVQRRDPHEPKLFQVKLNTKLLSLFIFFSIFIQGNANTFDLSFETLSVDRIPYSSKYKILESVDPGFHKTIIRIPNLPEAKVYVWRWERPLLLIKMNKHECSKETLIQNGELFGETIPSFVISSRGFLPGEKVTYTLETKDGKFVSHPITFCPQPIMQEMRSGQAKLWAQLVQLGPTKYEMFVEGIYTYEKLHLVFSCLGQKHDWEFFYKQGSCFAYTPKVLGKNSGFGKVSITRQKGDKFNLSLPWGLELGGHIEGESSPVVSDFRAIREWNFY